jgi:hypothetical protein
MNRSARVAVFVLLLSSTEINFSFLSGDRLLVCPFKALFEKLFERRLYVCDFIRFRFYDGV